MTGKTCAHGQPCQIILDISVGTNYPAWVVSPDGAQTVTLTTGTFIPPTATPTGPTPLDPWIRPTPSSRTPTATPTATPKLRPILRPQPPRRLQRGRQRRPRCQFNRPRRSWESRMRARGLACPLPRDQVKVCSEAAIGYSNRTVICKADTNSPLTTVFHSSIAAL